MSATVLDRRSSNAVLIVAFTLVTLSPQCCNGIKLPPQLFDDQWTSEVDASRQEYCSCNFLDNSCFFHLRMAIEFPYQSLTEALGFYQELWTWVLIDGCDGEANVGTTIMAWPISIVRWVICIFRGFMLGTQDHLFGIAAMAIMARQKMSTCLFSSPWAHAKLLTDPAIWKVLSNHTKDVRWHRYFRNWAQVVRSTPGQTIVPLREAYRRCASVEPLCWPSSSSTYLRSCLACCSPYEGPRGLFGCFTKEFSFQRCCSTESTVQSIVDARDTTAVAALEPQVTVLSRVALGTTNWKRRPVEWAEIAEEFGQSCDVQVEIDADSTTLADRVEEIDTWLRKGHEVQRLFHAADLYVTLRTCTLLDDWFVIGSGEDGAGLWFKSGAQCDTRIEWSAGDCCHFLGADTLERRSKRKQFFQAPCNGRANGRHYADVLGAYPLLNWNSAPIPTQGCSARDLDSVAILIGHPGYISVGHALHDFAFLGNVLRLASQGAFSSISKKFHIVPIKWYVRTWVEERGELEWRVSDRPFRELLLPLAQLFLDAALKFGADLDVSTIDITHENLNCWRCHLSTVQQWRFMSGDGAFWNAYRAHMLSFCGVIDPPQIPFRKKAVILQRTRYIRGLANLVEISAAVSRAVPGDWLVEVVVPGDLPEPCDQLRAVYDASVLVSVSGGEPYFAVAMPEHAAVIAIDANTMEGENVSDLSKKVSEEAWERFQEETSKHCNGPYYTSSGRPDLSSRDAVEGVANARNLWYTSLNNATCLQIPSSDCDSPWTMGLIEVDALALGRVITAVIRYHLSKWLQYTG